MDLYQAIVDFSHQHIANLEQSYTWEINSEHLPVDLSLSGKNIYEQNISLRHQLHHAFLATTDFEEKYKIIRWYIYHWGGVKANSNNTLAEYSQSPPETLILKGADGIASWSKALSIIDPVRYAIYDARVAMSLNALQVIYAVDSPQYFPPLKGRNTLINFFQAKLQTTFSQWNKASTQTFYQEYLALLQIVADQFSENVTRHEVEMLLFVHAEELSFQAAAKLVYQNGFEVSSANVFITN